MDLDPLHFLYVLPLFSQVLLLQASSSSRALSILRALSIIPTVVLAARAPFIYQFHPIELCIIPNVVLGLASVHAMWKSVEWGLADRSGYEWVGFNEKKQDEKEVDKIASGRNEKSNSMRAVLGRAFHLFISMRGAGYRFGPPPSPKLSLPQFLYSTLIRLLWSHIGVILTMGILSSPDLRENRLVSGIALGSMAWFGLICGFAFVSLLGVLVSILFSGSSFEPREYPLLIQEPYQLLQVTSATRFWSELWHSIFSRSFRFLAYDPAQALLGRSVGRPVGVLGVFALSAFVHQHSINAAMFYLEKKELSWTSFHGGTIYFLLQGVAMISEKGFESIMKRKVDSYGILSFAYGFIILVAVGSFLSDSWIQQGIFAGQAPIERWRWQRFVIPLAAFLPASIWTK